MPRRFGKSPFLGGPVRSADDPPASYGERLIAESLGKREISSPSEEAAISAAIAASLRTCEISPKPYVDDRLVCKICLDADLDVAITPCGHACACAECAASLKDCPICRGQIESLLKLFFA